MTERPEPMRIRDSRAFLANDETQYRFDSRAVDIIGVDGRTAFTVRLIDAGAIEIRATDVVKGSNGELLDDRLVIAPVASSAVVIRREAYRGD